MLAVKVDAQLQHNISHFRVGGGGGMSKVI